MSCRQCEGIESLFDAKVARRELRRYRRKGPRKTTRILLDAVREDAVGKTLLDIGGGVGVIQFELLGSGARSSTGVDASSAYLQVAREEAERRGMDDRVDGCKGDFVEMAPEIEPADIVTLDRVICCYPDVDALVEAAAAHARMSIALVYPRDEWWMRAVPSALNLVFRVRRSPMRFFLHASERVDAAVRRHGFALQIHRTTPMWQVAVYGATRLTRTEAPSPDRP